VQLRKENRKLLSTHWIFHPVYQYSEVPEEDSRSSSNKLLITVFSTTVRVFSYHNIGRKYWWGIKFGGFVDEWKDSQIKTCQCGIQSTMVLGMRNEMGPFFSPASSMERNRKGLYGIALVFCAVFADESSIFF